MRTTSLRGRLLKSLLVPILVGIVFVGAASCYSTYHEAAEIYDAEQVHFAKVLHTLAQQIDKAQIVDIAGEKRRNAYEKYITFRVWKNDDLFLQSDNVHDFGPVTQSEGFADRMIGDVRWRFYVERRGDVTVEVAEENEVRLDLVRHILAGVFLPQLIIIPVIAIIIGFGISRGLQPVERLSQLVRLRNINQLEPISTYGTARELRPMVDAINDLMGRVNDAMRIEKNFTNYAAHEMRTPIAALKTQAQVILRTQDANKQKQLAADLLMTIDRTQRIIEQLLTYARVQHQQVALSAVDLRALVLDEVRHVVPRAMEKQVTIDADALADCTLPVQEDLLRLALSNVLDNAVKYIGHAGRIMVELTPEGEGARIAVRDDGPGVSPEERVHLFDPFYRVTGNKAPGAGLGLAIVKWACDLQHIQISIESGLEGRGLGTLFHIPAP